LPPGSHDTWERDAQGQYLGPVSLEDPEFRDALEMYRLSE
jgi:hypothetical protein